MDNSDIYLLIKVNSIAMVVVFLSGLIALFDHWGVTTLGSGPLILSILIGLFSLFLSGWLLISGIARGKSLPSAERVFTLIPFLFFMSFFFVLSQWLAD